MGVATKPGSLVVLLAIAACAAAGCGSSSDSSSATSATAPPRENARSPLTQTEYQEELDDAASSIRSAMRGVQTARTTSGLESRREAAADELDFLSDDLRELIAPKPAATAHAGLVAALDELTLAATADSMACSGAAALTELSRSDGARNIRSAGAALAELGYSTRRLVLPRRRYSTRRLPNAKILERSGAGTGALSVTNGGNDDAVLKLVGGQRRTILSMYVRSGAVAMASGIAEGSYRVLFAGGRGWDAARRGFSRNCRFTRFEGRVRYRPNVRYTLTITPVQGGNTAAQPIDESEFLGR